MVLFSLIHPAKKKTRQEVGRNIDMVISRSITQRITYGYAA